MTNSGSTFTITRTSNTDATEKVRYRTVSLSAIAGTHFTAASGENVTFSTTAPVSSNGNSGSLSIALSQTVTTRGGSSVETLDKAIISFNQGSQLEKYIFNEENAKIYIPQGDKDYAIVCAGRDGACTVSTMPVNFVAKKNGEYTLTISESLNS